MNSLDKIIISPSGNFYGSEQVLFNFLTYTNYTYEVYVPHSSIFYKKLIGVNKHKINTFKSVKFLYFNLFFKLIFGSFHSIYLNEGGHVKYAKLLAKFFKRIKFFVHIRLVEDASPDRIGNPPPNLLLISISKYISEFLSNYRFKEFYDPLDVSDINSQSLYSEEGPFRIGIVGRVSSNKGLKYYDEFFDFIINSPFDNPVIFEFYGDVIKEDPDSVSFLKKWKNQSQVQIEFKGFVSDQNLLYKDLLLTLHLNPIEPLGRVGLESWARGIPFVGFSEGGVGEINRILGMDSYSIDRNSIWLPNLKGKIHLLMTKKNQKDFEKAKVGVSRYFGISNYVASLEVLLSS